MKQYKLPPKLLGYVYTYDEAVKSRDSGQILTIRIETSRICNLRCQYCCNRSGIALDNEIPYNKLLSIIDEAKDMGAKSIIVIGGGEPTIYPHFRDLIMHIEHLKLVPVVFTNAQTITLELAEFLFRHNVSVIIKLDSLDKERQDSLVGVEGAYDRIQNSLNNLKSVGYGSEKDNALRLGASFVVSKFNYDEIESIWRFCRQNNLFPNLEMMIPNGNAKEMMDKIVPASDWKSLKERLLAIDQNEFGYSWFPYTPLVGASCFQVMYNLYITVEGEVRPCSSIHCHIANVYRYSLREITELPFFRVARYIDNYLCGSCGSCDQHRHCIGCRGLAYAFNSDSKSDIEALCSPDPSCLYR